jgi:hypothetical protein
MTISRRAFGFSAAALALVAAAPVMAQSTLSAEDRAVLQQALYRDGPRQPAP